MTLYTCFKPSERKCIEQLIKNGLNLTEISRSLKRSISGVKSEIDINGGYENYDADKAQKNYEERRRLSDQRRYKKMAENPKRAYNPYRLKSNTITGSHNLMIRAEGLVREFASKLEDLIKTYPE